MKGQVLFFDKNTNKGIIIDFNKNRYHFHLGEWLSDENIEEGKKVFFEIPKTEAIDIYTNRKKHFIKSFFSHLFISWRLLLKKK